LPIGITTFLIVASLKVILNVLLLLLNVYDVFGIDANINFKYFVILIALYNCILKLVDDIESDVR
jgi:hypothetical protein